MSIPIEMSLDTNVAMAGGQSLVFHCHFYNCALQKAIEDGLGDEAPAVLEGAAAEVIRAQLVAAKGDRDAAGVLALAAEVFRECGFGTLDASSVGPDGGEAKVDASHYAMGWLAVHGERATPVCHFVSGFVRGAAAAAWDRPLEGLRVRETTCYACGGDDCRFAVETV